MGSTPAAGAGSAVVRGRNRAFYGFGHAPGRATDVRLRSGRSVRRARAEVLDAVDRMHGDVPHIDALQDAQRDVGAGPAAIPDLPVEVRLRSHAVTAHAEDDVA